MPFPQTPLQVLVELLIAGTWTDITSDVYLRNPISISRGRADEASSVDPASCSLTLNNRLGVYSPRNPRSPYFGLLGRNTPVRVSVTTPSGLVSRRFTGEISAWPPRWDLSGNDVWEPVEAAGIMRRLGQNTPALHDSLRRYIEAAGPLSYWPLTDGATATEGSEVVHGGPGSGMRFYNFVPGPGVDWAGGTLAKWLDPVVQLPGDSTCDMKGFPLPQPVAEQGWSVDFFRSGVGTDMNLALAGRAAKSDADPRIRWDITVGSSLYPEIDLSFTEFGDTYATTSFVYTADDASAFDPDVPHHVRLTIIPNGSGCIWELWMDGALRATDTSYAKVQQLNHIFAAYSTKDPNGDTGPMTVGHIAYWGPDAPDAFDVHQALLGHAGELAGRRIERLCAEQAVPLQVRGNLDKTPPMGQQQPGKFLDLLRAAEAVDGGVLGEARDDLALSYRARTSHYNEGT